ncbi:MAG: MATE family efflux transporter [Peptoniphilaceae bacterium]|nr:MATE family efflux transporter [Peptoniphilaceae bacterium]MDY6086286.1 MATE family efflux transporter [Peptoniphilaceae bacterium]
MTETKKEPSVLNRRFLQRVAAIALPVALQTLITTAVSTADTVMISSLGSASIAAVGLVNQFVFLFQIIAFGIGGAGAVFFAQFFGHEDIKSLRRYVGLTLRVALVVGAAFGAVAFFFPTSILRFMIDDPEVIAIGVRYLSAVAFSLPLFGISVVLEAALRSVNRAREPLFITVVAFFTNVFFNYVFIFGAWGAPRLGVLGAAVGTVIARVVECIALMSLVVLRAPRAANVRPMGVLKADGALFREFFPIAFPIVLTEASWATAQLFFAIAYARLGRDATAAVQLTNTINNLFFILNEALCSASAVLLGQSLGAGRLHEADRMSVGLLKLNLLVGLFSLAVMVFFPGPLLRIYGVLDPTVHDVSVNLLVIRGFAIPFRFITSMFLVGIFRAGGETKRAFLIEACTIWLYAMPLSFLGTQVFHWPIEVVYALVASEEVIKMGFYIALYRKKTWLKALT